MDGTFQSPLPEDSSPDETETTGEVQKKITAFSLLQQLELLLDLLTGASSQAWQAEGVLPKTLFLESDSNPHSKKVMRGVRFLPDRYSVRSIAHLTYQEGYTHLNSFMESLPMHMLLDDHSGSIDSHDDLVIPSSSNMYSRFLLLRPCGDSIFSPPTPFLVMIGVIGSPVFEVRLALNSFLLYSFTVCSVR
eukprot:Lankesteria_metandrocarpae@DN10682_c0_g1_i1.p1